MALPVCVPNRDLPDATELAHDRSGQSPSRGVRNMHRKMLRFGRGFRTAAEVRKVQAAEMVLAPGEKEGDADNYHRGADQWLFVVEGTGAATIEGRRVALKPGMLVVIERRERHEIRNTGRVLLKTLNFYYPPAFTRGGNPKGPGKKLSPRSR
jgi:mannose-6-phosphate isomerase-like protein (cupin superfamily)